MVHSERPFRGSAWRIKYRLKIPDIPGNIGRQFRANGRRSPNCVFGTVIDFSRRKPPPDPSTDGESVYRRPSTVWWLTIVDHLRGPLSSSTSSYFGDPTSSREPFINAKARSVPRTIKLTRRTPATASVRDNSRSPNAFRRGRNYLGLFGLFGFTIRYEMVCLRAHKGWQTGRLNLAHGTKTKNEKKKQKHKNKNRVAQKKRSGCWSARKGKK